MRQEGCTGAAWQALAGWSKNRWAQRGLGLLVVGFPLLLLGLIIVGNWGQLTSYAWHLRPLPLVLSLALYVAGVGLGVLEWSLIMGRLAGVHSLRKNAKIYSYSTLAKRLPGTYWYVAGRMLLYDEEGVARATTAAGAVLELASTILSGLLVYLLSLPFCLSTYLAGLPSIWRSGYLGLLIAILGVVFLRPALVSTVLSRLARFLGKQEVSVTFGARDTLTWLTLHSVAWVVGGVVLYLLITALQPFPWTALPAAINMTAAAGLVGLVAFIFPSGLGIKELTLAYLLSFYVPLPVAAALALLFRFWVIGGDLLWALLAVRL
jgi:hypothetical protein